MAANAANLKLVFIMASSLSSLPEKRCLLNPLGPAKFLPRAHDTFRADRDANPRDRELSRSRPRQTSR
jgi:hypothetical protein